jgi:prolyl-tRNA synthetase
MRYSQAFIPSLREAPKDATTPSHIFLLRGGFVRMIGAGIYEMLPLGQRVLSRVSEIVRREMNRAGAQEVLMPVMLPAEYFQETGRWDTFGDALLRLKDRRGADYHLGPTHEEIITDMVRRDVKSYRQLPLNLYQVQQKFRDEARPRAGLLRCREFIMKDAYSFDVDETAALKSYEAMREAYHRIFKKLGLDYRIVQADSGAMGGSTSAEFQVLAQTGEDAIVACAACDYAANVEVAETKWADVPTAASSTNAVEKIRTPGQGGIDDVVRFLAKKTIAHASGEPFTAAQTLKCLLVSGDGAVVMAIVRGDREVNPIALAKKIGVAETVLATELEVKEATGAAVGYAGPVGFKGRIVIDPEAAAVVDALTGANETDHHLANVNYLRDFSGEVAPIRQVTGGDACPKCGGTLASYRGIEGGHIFILGTHYSAKMGASFLDEAGQQKTMIMGCYGIGVSRLVASAIEQHHDADGILWPMSIAPYHVVVSPIGKEEAAAAAAETLYAELRDRGVEALLDDRNERPGVKFKDADLIGIPLRVVVGARGLAEGKLEVKKRSEKEPFFIPLEGAADALRDLVVAAGGSLVPA